MYRVKGEGYTNSELRTLQDWTIRLRLRTVDGVADVNSMGGFVRAFEVRPDPRRMASQGLSIDELERAIERNNRNAGGDRINRKDSMLLVRTLGQLRDADDLRRITVVTRSGAPVRVSDVAGVREGALVRYGGVTADGQGDAVTGLVLLRVGANSRTVVEAVKQELARLAPTLPKGVTIEPYYDRAELINAAVLTVEKALGEAVVLVVLVLIVLLGNLRAALTVALILPLSVLFTFILMKLFGVTANLMSLGVWPSPSASWWMRRSWWSRTFTHQLAHAPKGVSRLHLVYRAVTEVATPVLSGILIIAIVFLPLFSLTGLEGRMFTPLALTIVFALLGSLLLSFTVIPVLASFLMRGGAHGEDRVLAAIKRVYLPVMRWALAHRKTAVGGALVVLVLAAALFPFHRQGVYAGDGRGPYVGQPGKGLDISLEASLAPDAPIQKAQSWRSPRSRVCFAAAGRTSCASTRWASTSRTVSFAHHAARGVGLRTGDAARKTSRETRGLQRARR